MRIRIGDREYPVVGPRGSNGQLRGGMSMQALFDLRRQSPDVFGFEVGLAKLGELEASARRAKSRRAAALEAGDTEAADAAQASVADDALVNAAVIVFLSRRAAGDACTLADVAALDPEAIEWVREPGDPSDNDAAESPDPTSPGPQGVGSPETDSDVRQVAGKRRTTSRAGRGTTSRSRSVGG